MKNLIQALTALTLTAASLFVFAGPAAANPIEYQYADNMAGLLSSIDLWSADLDELSMAAVAKPELACSAEMAELSRIGASIADDLAGTSAPEFMGFSHGQLTGAVAQMANLAGESCGDAEGAAHDIATLAETDLAPASEAIGQYVEARGTATY